MQPSDWTVWDRFDWLENLPEGSTGRAALVQRRGENQRLVLKRLDHLAPALAAQAAERLDKLQALRHPALCPPLEIWQEKGRWFVLREAIDGLPLMAYVAGAQSSSWQPRRNGRAFPPVSAPHGLKRLRRMLPELCRAIATLHRAELGHGALTPRNIFMNAHGQVQLCDYGLTCGVVLGSPKPVLQLLPRLLPYLAPEVCICEPHQPQADWYSLGAVLYEAFTGRPPFQGTLSEMVKAKKGRSPRLGTSRQEDLSEHLVELCHGLLSKRPERRPNGGRVLALVALDATGARAADARAEGPPPLIGRESEQATLDDLFGRVVRGAAAVATASGPAGAGRATFARAFLSRRQRRGDALVLETQCRAEGGEPFASAAQVVQCLIEALRQFPERALDLLLPPTITSLLAPFPEFSRLPAVAQSARHRKPPEDPYEHLGLAARTLRDLLGNVCQNQPVVVALHNADRMDADSQRLLERVFAPPTPRPLLLLLTLDAAQTADGRPELDWLPESSPQLARLHLQLSALVPEDAARCARMRLAGRVENAGRWSRHIAGETGGDPLFIDLLTAFLATHKHLPRIPDKDHPNLTLADCVSRARRLLPPLARELLDTVVVAGPGMAERLVLKAARCGTQAESAIALLRSLRLVRSNYTGSVRRLECRHRRVAAHLVAELSAAHIRTLHVRLAQALEADGAVAPELLYRHTEGAGDGSRSLRYAQLAAERASRALALRSAAAWHGRLRTHLAPQTTDGARAALRHAQALAMAGERIQAARVYLEAHSLSGAMEDTLPALAVAQLLSAGQWSRGIEILAVLTASQKVRRRPPGRVSTNRLLRRLESALQELNEGASAPTGANSDPSADLLMMGATAISLLSPKRAGALHASHLARALDGKDPVRLVRAAAMEVAFLASMNRLDPNVGEQTLLVARDIAQRLDSPLCLGTVNLARAIAALNCGSWRAAEARGEEAQTGLAKSALDLHWEHHLAAIYRVLALSYSGRLQQTRRLCELARSEALLRGQDAAARFLLRAPRIPLALVEDRPGARSFDPRRALASVAGTDQGLFRFWVLSDHVSALLYEGQADHALESLEEDWRELKKSLLPEMPLVQFEIARLKGLARCAVAARSQEPEPILRRVAAQILKLRRYDHPLSITLADHLEACAILADEGPDRAVESLNHAAREYARLEMWFDAAALRYVAGHIQGGEEGEKAVSQATSYFAREGVVAPERLVHLAVPNAPQL